MNLETIPEIRGEAHRVPIGSLVHHPDNYNVGDVGLIASSIKRLGMYRPLVVQRSTQRICAGNHTWDALRALGASEVDAWVVDVDDELALDILLSDNHIAAQASPNEAKVVALLQGIHERRGSLEGTSFSLEALDDMVRSLNKPMFPKEVLSELPQESQPHEVECPSCGHRFAA